MQTTIQTRPYPMTGQFFITDEKIAIVGKTLNARPLIYRMIKERGGIVHNTVKKATDIVVLGREISSQVLARLEKNKQTIPEGEFLELIDVKR